MNDIIISRLHEIYPSLYGKSCASNTMDQRFISLINRHREIFGNESPMLFSASGRTEIAGNHTDHNQGKVIGGSINLDTIAAVSARTDTRVILASEGFPVIDVDISDTSIKEYEENTTAAIVRGIARAFKDRGIDVKGWEANTATNVLKGSGLSSSAAIEVLCAEIFNNLYNNDRLSPIELAKIGQFAENSFFGKPSGLLDQICCANGGISSIDFKRKENPIVTSTPLDLSDFGYLMIITDTKGNHADLTDEYSAVPAEMKSVASFYGKESLREVDFNSFLNDIAAIRKEINNDRAVLRAYHFFSENERIDKLEEAIRKKDFNSFLRLINESGSSSFRFLQNVYPSSQPAMQGLSIGIALSEHIIGNNGAVRVHGGGFAGTIQAYVAEEKAASYIAEMEKVFGDGASVKIEIRDLPVCRIY